MNISHNRLEVIMELDEITLDNNTETIDLNKVNVILNKQELKYLVIVLSMSWQNAELKKVKDVFKVEHEKLSNVFWELFNRLHDQHNKQVDDYYKELLLN